MEDTGIEEMRTVLAEFLESLAYGLRTPGYFPDWLVNNFVDATADARGLVRRYVERNHPWVPATTQKLLTQGDQEDGNGV